MQLLGHSCLPFNCQTAEDAAGAELQRYLDKVLPVFKKSIDRSTDAEIKYAAAVA